MTIRRNRSWFSRSTARKNRRSDAKRTSNRPRRVESLEERRLLATGPQLIGVQPNGGTLLELDPDKPATVLSVAPRELTLRYDDSQVIQQFDADGEDILSTSLQLTRGGPDRDLSTPDDNVIVTPGFIGINDSPNQNEIVIRFAQTLPDDNYRLEVFGEDDVNAGQTALINDEAEPLMPLVEDTDRDTIEFRLDLGAQITSIVPQPIVRNANGGLIQHRNQIHVYFNNDDLDDDGLGASNASDTSFYQLIATADTATNTDDAAPVFPTSVDYDPDLDRAVLTFADDLDDLAATPGALRLRIGTDEAPPLAPHVISAEPRTTHDFNTDDGVVVAFDADEQNERGNGIYVDVTTVDLRVPHVTTIDPGGQAVFNVADGVTFDVERNGAVVATFELNSGPETLLDYDLTAGESIRDGESFVVDGVTYEFNTGPVLEVDGAAGNGTTGNFRDQETFTISDDAGDSITFEINHTSVGGGVAVGNVPVTVFAGMPATQVVNQILATINFANFNVQSARGFGASSNRISLRQDSTDPAMAPVNGVTGLTVSGNHAIAGDVAIPVEEVFTAFQTREAIANVFNTTPGVAGVTVSHDGPRMNFSGATTANFAGTPLMDDSLASDGTVAGTNIAINFLADDDGADLADRIAQAAAANGITAEFSGNAVTFTSPTERAANTTLGMDVPPAITVNGKVIEVALSNGGAQTTAQELVDALNNHPAASALINASIQSGNAGLDIATPATDVSLLLFDLIPTTPQATSDFGTGGQAGVTFVSVQDNETGTGVKIELEKINLGANVPPEVLVNGDTITIRLNTSPGGKTTANILAHAVNTHPQARQLVTVLVAGDGDIDIATPVAVDAARPEFVLQGLGSAFASASDLGALGAQSQIISSTIDPQNFGIDFPGALDDPGHRTIEVEQHLARNDSTDGITVGYYNFQNFYGVDPTGNRLLNAITENQKQRTREIFELYGYYLGVQFVETENLGMTVVTGDLRALNPTVPTGAGGVLGIATFDVPAPFTGGLAIMDAAETWDDSFGESTDPNKFSWFETAMHEIGHVLGLGHTYELPQITVQGGAATEFDNQSQSLNPVPAEPVFPGDHDIAHGQHLYRPEGKDIDLYRFELVESGLFAAEVFAERQPEASMLDAALTVYRQNADGSHELVARNDDYFSEDPMVRLSLDAGVYVIGVSSTGNTSYDPNVEDSGIGGRTEGAYDLRLDFRPNVTSSLADTDGTAFDGDNDGAPGGVHDFWFRTAKPKGEGGTAGDQTIFVDKSNQPLSSDPNPPNGTRANPYNNLIAAFNNSQPGDIVRVVGNGGDDGLLETVEDNNPYIVGQAPASFGGPLPDGTSITVPKDVTLMVDAGAVFKMRNSNVVVGSTTPSVDRSGSALQVLGTPFLLDANGEIVRDENNSPIPGSVYFTSFDDEHIGADTNPVVTQTPDPGEWGGILFNNNLDKIEERPTQADQGAFVNYINHADIRYGGGKVNVGSVQQTVNPIHVVQSLPTVAYNTISFSADAAMSADPNSFEEINYNSPRFQAVGPFTSDYDRVGPDIYGNTLNANSLNGLFIRIETLPGQPTNKLTVPGRIDDTDIPHILTENLEILGTPGGSVLEIDVPPIDLVTLSARGGGTLDPAGTFNYRVTFVDAAGNESPASQPTVDITLPGVNGVQSVRLNRLPPVPPDSSFVARRLYRSTEIDPDTGRPTGPYELVANLDASDVVYTDTGATVGGFLDDTVVGGVLRARRDASLVIDPSALIKLADARITTTISSQLVAEGHEGQEVVFTSLLDDRFGGGGTFDTNNDGSGNTAVPGDWGGIFAGHTSTLSIDHAFVNFGGGVTTLGGSFAGFNAIEVHQADARITNSTLQFNSTGVGGQAPAQRFGLGSNAEGVIFVRGAQPIIADNIIRDTVDEDDTIDTPAVNININSFNSRLINDWGRSSGFVDVIGEEMDNQGPMISGNLLGNNEVNGMVVRPGTTTTEVVLDDTSIVHAVYDEITVPDFHTYGGVRLESDSSQSLVVKLMGPDAGVTATGRPLDIDDRIGGALHLVGQPGFPVVLTSLNDCTVGAGFTPEGLPQVATLQAACGVVEPDPSPPPMSNIPPFADVVVVIDESGSMAFAQQFSASFITDLEAGLVGAGIGDGTQGVNQFGLVGFGGSGFGAAPHELGHQHDVGGAQFGSAAEYVTATQSLVTNGAVEDGWEAVQFMLDNYNFRPNAAKFAILVTDEPRATLDQNLDFAGMLAGLNAADVNLQGILTTTVTDGTNTRALALDNMGTAFLADGSGGFTTSTGATSTTSTNIQTNYVDLALQTDGIVGDIRQIQQGGATAQSFANALVSSIVGQAGGGMPPPMTELAGDWGSVRFDRFAHDRNADVALEKEPSDVTAPGINASPDTAQFVGTLAPHEKAGDESQRLAFEVHGFLSEPADVDVYSFNAVAGTEVWFDIDRTTQSLDTVVELIDADGRVLARSDNSLAEQQANAVDFVAMDVDPNDPNDLGTPAVQANRLQKSLYEPGDFYTINPRDAGMRVVLPGTTGVSSTFHVRVRSSSDDLGGEMPTTEQLTGGISSGVYKMQIRLREEDEFPGSKVQYADIRFATNGVEILGQPLHSPLAGEAAEADAPNDTLGSAQSIGNQLASDRGAISLAGAISDPGDVDFFQFEVEYENTQDTQGGRAVGDILHSPTTFDIDYADGLSRGDLLLSIFDANGRLVLTSKDSNIAEDQPNPIGGLGVDELSRGSAGVLDPYIGPVELPAGTYYAVVSPNSRIPQEMEQFLVENPTNPFVRLEPVDSIERLAEDRIGFSGGSNIPGTSGLPVLFDDTDGRDWHLGDVTLFVSQNFGLVNNTRSTVVTVDPFTGARETTLGSFQQPMGDIVMRQDGELFTFSTGPTNGNLNPGNTGNHLLIDTGTAAQTQIGDDDLSAFDLDNNGNIAADNGGVIQYQGIAYSGTGNNAGFVVGNRADHSTFFPHPNVDYSSNILYNFRRDSGDVRNNGTDNNDSRRSGNARLEGAGTDDRELGQIITDVSLANGSTVLMLPDVTEVDAAGMSIFNINDGDTFVVEYNTGNVGTPNSAVATFEFDSGPETLLDYDVAAGDSLADGEFFFVDGDRYEFDTGRVLQLAPNVGAGAAGNYRDGETFTITDDNGDLVVFEINHSADATGQVGPGRVAVNVVPGMTLDQIATEFVNKINGAGFGVQATRGQGAANDRITLEGDSDVTDSVTGLTLSGDYGVTAGSAAVPIEEIYTAVESRDAIAQVFNVNPGVAGITASHDGPRMNFSGALNADFSGAMFLDDSLTSLGGVTGTNISIDFLAADSGADLAARIVQAVNNASLVGGTPTAPQPISAQQGAPTATTIAGNNTVTFSTPPTDPLVMPPNTDPFVEVQVSNNAIVAIENGPGGLVTGIDFIGGQLYAVTDTGALFQVSTFGADVLTGALPTRYVLNGHNDLLGTPFSGLSAGPADVEGGRYANMLFGIDINGGVHALNTLGELQPVFADGASSVQTGAFNANGLAFSTLDRSLWDVTISQNPQRDLPGHAHNQPFTLSSLDVDLPSNALYFGNQNNGRAAGNKNSGNAGTGTARNFDYNFPGGAHGSMISREFDLSGYSFDDQPALYFNYFLETEDVNWENFTTDQMRDSFRVYVGDESGNWSLVGTNNLFQDFERADEFDIGHNDGFSQHPFAQVAPDVQKLFDSTGTWRQARVPLADFAGQDNIRLRFDFATAGSMNVGNPRTYGDELRAVAGADLRDGAQFLLSSGQFGGADTFEIDLGYSLVAPTGANITDGEQFVIDGVTYEFDDGNGALPPAPFIAVPFNASMSASEVADSIVQSLVSEGAAPQSLTGDLTATEPANDILAGAHQSGLNRAGQFTGNGVIGDNPSFPAGQMGSEVDLIAFQLSAGATVDVNVDVQVGGGTLDSVLRLFDGFGTQLDFDDDGGVGLGSALSFTAATSGTYYVGVSSFSNFNYSPNVEGSGFGGSTGAYEITLDVTDPSGGLHRNGHRINLPDAQLITETLAAPGFVEGAPGTFASGGIPVPINSTMNSFEVANAIRQTIADTYSAGDATNIKGYEEFTYAIGHDVLGSVASPFGGKAIGIETALAGEEFGSFGASGPVSQTRQDSETGINNAFTGVYLDDIIIGFAERGETVVEANPNPTFRDNIELLNPELSDHTSILEGAYQLEIRRAAEYGTTIDPAVPELFLDRAFDTNDRLTEQYSLIAPRGESLADGDTFTLSDGLNTVTFEYDDTEINAGGDGVTAGHVRIPFTRGDTDIEIAAAIRTAINGPGAQSVLEITAGLSDGADDDVGASVPSTSNRVDLFGNAIISVDTAGVTGQINVGDPFLSNDVFEFANTSDTTIDQIVLKLPTGQFFHPADGTDASSSGPDINPASSDVQPAFSFNQPLNPDTVTIDTAAFEPGETFIFGIDVDPAFVASDLVGTTYTITFGDGSVLNGQFVATAGGSVAAVLDLANTARAVRFEDFGDDNLFRDQGQIVVSQSFITDSAGVGVLVDAGARESGGNAHAGPVRALPELNTNRLVPGPVIANNVIARNDLGGITISGDTDPAGGLAPVPVVRVVNNTIFGVNGGDVGIMVDENSSPTLLNNIVANAETGVEVDDTSFDVVLGGTIYRGNTTNTAGIGLGDSFINYDDLDPETPLFISAGTGNFLPADGSLAIDSSVSSLDDRDALITVRDPLGIDESPVLAPSLDLFGQLRVDAPGESPSPGPGISPSIDRGALDRSDFTGPTAVLNRPRDNDAQNLDQDAALTIVQRPDGLFSRFEIQLNDGGAAAGANPEQGVGIDPATVTSAALTLFQDSVRLIDGVHYRFSYDRTNSVIRLTPVTGVFDPRAVYTVTLNNTDLFIIDAQPGAELADGNTFDITDGNDNVATFEFDSGYTMTVLQTLSLEVPLGGGDPLGGGILDGEHLVVDDGMGGAPITIEFDADGIVDNAGAFVIPFEDGSTGPVISTVDEIADELTQALGASLPGTAPVYHGEGVITISSVTPNFNTTFTQITQTGVTGRISDGESFRVFDGTNDRLLNFEFDNDGFIDDFTSIPILFEAGDTVHDVADLIVEALERNPTGLTPNILPLDDSTFTGPILEQFQLISDQSVTVDVNNPLTQTFTVDQSGLLSSLELPLRVVGPNIGGDLVVDILDNSGGVLNEATPLATVRVLAGDVAANFPFTLQTDAILGTLIDLTEAELIVDEGDELAFRLSTDREPNDGYIVRRSTNPLVQTTTGDISSTEPNNDARPGAHPSNLTRSGVFTGDGAIGDNDSLANPADDVDLIRIDVVQGANVQVTVDTSNVDNPGLDSALTILDTNGIPLFTNDNTNGVDPAIEFEAFASGRYFIQVSSADAVSTGDYDVSIRVEDIYPEGRLVGTEFEDLTFKTFVQAEIAPQIDIHLGGTSQQILQTPDTQLLQAGVPGARPNFGIRVPFNGGAQLPDGASFGIDNGAGVQVNFEFDNDGNTAGTTFVIPFEESDSPVDIADAVVNAVGNTSLGLTPVRVSADLVELGGDVGTTLDLSNSPLVQVGQPGLPPAIAVTVSPSPDFDETDVAAAIANAIESSELEGLSLVVRQDIISIEGAKDLVGAVDSRFLAAIKDRSGNELNSNRAGGQTRFAVLLGDQVFDYGDAPDSSISPSIEFPVSLDDDGARHVVVEDNPLYLGAGVDFDPNGNPTASANGDSFDLTVDTTDSGLIRVSSPPGTFLTQVPSAGGTALGDGDTFTINDGNKAHIFEFDKDSPADITDADHERIPVADGDTQEEVAAEIIAAIRRANVSARIEDRGAGTIFLTGNDEDGVTINGPINPAVSTPVTVEVSKAGLLDAWIDFNRDGDWNDPGEQIFANQVLVGGTNQLSFTAPQIAAVTANAGAFARFRVSVNGGLSPTGLAEDGEVEDYLLSLTAGQPPQVVDDSFPAEEDAVLDSDVSVLGNDTDPPEDPNGDALTVDVSKSATQSDRGATVTFMPDGNFIYDPTDAPNLQLLPEGASVQDTFTYVVTDGTFESTGTVTINISGINDPPTPRNDPFVGDDPALFATNENTPLEFNPLVNILNNDSDIDQGDSFSLVLSEARVPGEMLYRTFSDLGVMVTVRPDGRFRYDPTMIDPDRDPSLPNIQDLSAGEVEEDTFTYEIEDEFGAVSEATVTVTVTGANDPVMAVDDPDSSANPASFETDEDTILNSPANLLDNDIDPDRIDTLTVSSFSGQSVLGATVVVTPSGTFTYDPTTSATLQSLAPGNTQVDTFTYTVTDGTAQSTGTVAISVTGANDNPTAVDDPPTPSTFGYTTSENTPLLFNALVRLTQNDFDLDVGDAITAVPLTTTSAQGAVVQVRADGTFRYDPRGVATLDALAPGQTLQDTFVYTIEDLDGATDNATVTIRVTGENDAPVAVDDEYVTFEDFLFSAPFSGVPGLLGNDFDPDTGESDSLTVVGFDSISAMGAVVAVDSQGGFTYDPTGSDALNALAEGEAATDTFTYTIRDTSGLTATGVVSLEINGINDAPTANDDSFTIPQLASAQLRVLDNDEDIDGSLDPTSLTIVEGTSSGTLQVDANGIVTYTPAVLVDQTFTYQVRDVDGAVSNIATATITVNRDLRDVNASGQVTTLDALLLVNAIRDFGNPFPITPPNPTEPPFYDTNDDGVGDIADLRNIVQRLRELIENGNGVGGAGGEGEPAPLLVSQPAMPVANDPINVHQGMVAQDRSTNGVASTERIVSDSIYGPVAGESEASLVQLDMSDDVDVEFDELVTDIAADREDFDVADAHDRALREIYDV